MKQRYFKVEKNRGACLVEGLLATAEGVEPVFVIRASDVHAPRAIRAYLDLTLGTAYPDEARRELVTLANDFQIWQSRFSKHEPDGRVKSQQLSTNEPLEIKIIDRHGRQERVLLNDPDKESPANVQGLAQAASRLLAPAAPQSQAPTAPPSGITPPIQGTQYAAGGFIGEGADAKPAAPAAPALPPKAPAPAAAPKPAAAMPRKPAPPAKAGKK